MRIIGWDSAVQEKNNGLVLAEYTDQSIAILEKWEGKRSLQETLTAWISGAGQILLAVDSPLGWPAEFGSLLASHLPGKGFSCEPADFFKRKTDLNIYKRFSKMPLEVSADRIARSTFFTLNRIETLRCDSGRNIEVLWDWQEDYEVGVIEVYPAATLIAGGRSIRGYKKKENRSVRSHFLKDLAGEYTMTIGRPEDFTEVEHDFDALICCLAGADFLLGLCEAPLDQDPRVWKEGWCWTRKT